MKTPMVRHQLNLANPPSLTEGQKAEIEAIRALPDEDIDLGDIAALDDAFWKTAALNPYYKPVKTSTTVRIDADVLAWLRAQGKGYQTRINSILRRAMIESIG